MKKPINMLTLITPLILAAIMMVFTFTTPVSAKTNMNLYKSKTVTKSVDNVCVVTYDKKGKIIRTTYSWRNSNDHPTIEYNEPVYGGYWKGTLKRDSYLVYPSTTEYFSDGAKLVTTVIRGFYKATVYYYPDAV